MLAKRGADKNRGNVGAHGEQIINQLRYAVVIEARQRFEDIQAGGFPKVIHFSGLTMLNGQPAVTARRCNTSRRVVRVTPISSESSRSAGESIREGSGYSRYSQ